MLDMHLSVCLLCMTSVLESLRLTLFRSLSSLNMYKMQCIGNTLTSIVKNCNRCSRHLLFSMLLDAKSNLTVSSSSFTMVNLDILDICCLFIMEDIAQDTTFQIKGSWRFLNIIHLYISKKMVSCLRVCLRFYLGKD